ncbi:MAG TPA: ATP-binding protein [Telluria sp.]|nr:ATP-binding protein [Telluria sp.]
MIVRTAIGNEGSGAPERVVLSIRSKGMIVFAALLAYFVLISAFVFYQKNTLMRDFEAIEGTMGTEAMLKEADVATFHTVIALFVNGGTLDDAAMARIGGHYDALMLHHKALTQRLPGSYLDLRPLDNAATALVQQRSKASLNRMVAELVESKNGLAALTEQVQRQRKAAFDRYRSQSNSVALTALGLGMLGLGLLGAIIGLFFRRLTDDLRVLQRRAIDIVQGYRGEPLPVTRHDEVGQLMGAVNSMAGMLDQREREEMVQRQTYLHQEKMAAIGTLAAGLAHEIGNPIAAISGLAQEMIATRDVGCGTCGGCSPELIVAQTTRLSSITREIADFASPRTAEPQYLDLNEQVRSTASLLRYDRRLKHVTLNVELDSQLPAIYGVADQFTQLVMNLLINAMDAVDGVSGRTPAITVSTRCDGERASLVVEDNGCGMDADTRDRAFEAFFTTKPAGKGTGLGLSLCYSIVKMHGGSIDLVSTPGVGTRVQMHFPLNDTSFNEDYKE